eukprot:TRINITY_DN24444_c0_g1_i2.p1 TRINITY_DN24444_c0_g1~~TRINITY_DN24444_c0_g1_i2.p1  ORF type:complete len:210 (-),score=25.56 TRINITY_DN24444_c0_g1_i2:169-798(-)
MLSYEQYAAHKNLATPHYSQNYCLEDQFVGKVKHKLGQTTCITLPPCSAATPGWKAVRRFLTYMNGRYPGPHERTSAAIKVYRTGDDHMGEHTDRLMHLDTPIGSLSLGATRNIIVREEKTEENKKRWNQGATRQKWVIELKHGDIFVMGGERFQLDFTHELPAQKDVKGGRAAVVLRPKVLIEKQTVVKGKRSSSAGCSSPPKRRRKA